MVPVSTAGEAYRQVGIKVAKVCFGTAICFVGKGFAAVAFAGTWALSAPPTISRLGRVLLPHGLLRSDRAFASSFSLSLPFRRLSSCRAASRPCDCELGFSGSREKERERIEEKMSRSLGIPVKLLHEAAGHVVTTELKTGEVYRGTMVECEDNWNCQLENITFTAKVRASYALLWQPWPRI
jgi:small nuclear ribonucleoprotein (snRNP)-like protein